MYIVADMKASDIASGADAAEAEADSAETAPHHFFYDDPWVAILAGLVGIAISLDLFHIPDSGDDHAPK